jgi:hypothetical protein
LNTTEANYTDAIVILKKQFDCSKPMQQSMSLERDSKLLHTDQGIVESPGVFGRHDQAISTRVDELRIAHTSDTILMDIILPKLSTDIIQY